MKLQDELNDLIKEFARITESKIVSELSWTTNIKKNVKVVTGKDSLQLVMPDYGVFVDSGRKPGKQPPLNIIYEWCESKNIPTEYAFPIARKIGKEGLPAHPFIHIFEEATEDLAKDIGKLITKNLLNGLS